MEFEPAIVVEEWEMILDFFENAFGMNNHGIVFFTDRICSIPDFLYKRTGRIIGIRINPA